MSIDVLSGYIFERARGGAVGWGTALQAGTSVLQNRTTNQSTSMYVCMYVCLTVLHRNLHQNTDNKYKRVIFIKWLCYKFENSARIVAI
jgi:hypothetical protein